MQVVATAGHVDHGKSTLVRALTGMEPDRLAEERDRGLTIDLGFAWTDLPGGARVAFVDVPGHERFVPTMLAGVGPVPAVLFVVAADEGWMPQSTEHRDALAALGVERGLLVVTRSDLMEPDLAIEEARDHLAGTPLADMTAVGVSAATGAGMDELRRSLSELVAGMPVPDPEQDVRLWVDRAFTIRGAGTVVTGTLGGGRLRVDDELVLEPGGRPVRVRGLRSMDSPLEQATGVARIAVNLRGVPKEAVGRGDALLTPGRWLTTDTVDVRLRPLRPRGPGGVQPAGLPRELMLHIGSAAVAARVRPLTPGEAVHARADAAEPGGWADGSSRSDVAARLTLRHRLPLRIGDRALLRDPGAHRIVAGLTVLDVRPPALTRRGAATRRATELAELAETPSATDEVARRRVVHRRELAAMGADPDSVDPTTTLIYGDWLVDRRRADEWARHLVEAVTGHDSRDPLNPGVPVATARRTLGLPSDGLLEAVLAAVRPAGSLVLHRGRVQRAATVDAGLSPELRAALDALRADLLPAPFLAPETGRLEELGLGPEQLAALVRAGELERIGPGIYLLPGAEQAAVDVLTDLPSPEFTLSTARQALGTTRRVAVPLLELLARRGRTARTDDGGHRLLG
ncbi:MAG TPA: selenocysteine-specific translation elongation factor [Pseudonocardia sp.]|nr:selenocysteine-specific translation elongation factor [Pseudonocardia sp.]